MPAVVITDMSGSVLELGKRRTAVNLVRAVKWLDRNAEIFAWQGNNITQAQDLEAVKPAGKSDVSALYNFITRSEHKRFLLISDGNFEPSINLKPSGKLIRTLALGADADLRRLQKLSSNDTVYLAENVRAAFDSTSYDYDD